jgi:RNA polymerase sigma-70 factor (ECF subfamily)
LTVDDQGFARLVMPHLDAGYNLARWLLRRPEDADDAMQEAMLRAFRYADGCREATARQWFLRIVRNAAYDLMGSRGDSRLFADIDAAEMIDTLADPGDSAEVLMMRADDRRLADAMLAALPEPYREVVILCELEELSYRETAEVCGIPIGTVMSRLKRGRDLMQSWGRRHRGRT